MVPAKVTTNPLYRIWRGMMQRCHQENHRTYPGHGGKGIRVCERWHDFGRFCEDVGERPPGLTLERKDNLKGYSPDNCKWATPLEQANNRSNNHLLTVGDETLTLAQWSRKTGVLEGTICARIRKGFSPEKCIYKGRLPCRTS